jgi:hypothetical protein
MTARAILLLILIALAPALIYPATAAERQMTPACAERDLKVVALIEAGAEARGAAIVLSQAGVLQLQARIACLAGHEREALALYDGIIRSLSRTLEHARR